MNTRAYALPAIAVALVTGVMGVQVANGGGDFVPVRSADPCAPRDVTAVSARQIDALGERLVLLGLDGAACHLGITREQLVINLALSTDVPDPVIDALRTGLLGAVDRMKADGTLPPASDLADEALAEADLNGFVKAAIKALPDSVVNAALKTDDVLRRAVNDLDLRQLLSNLEDPNELENQISAAVTQAVKDSLRDRLRDLVPGL
jgi:hypothetical protein